MTNRWGKLFQVINDGNVGGIYMTKFSRVRSPVVHNQHSNSGSDKNTILYHVY